MPSTLEPKFPHAPSFAPAPFMSINPSDGNNLRGDSNIYSVWRRKCLQQIQLFLSKYLHDSKPGGKN